MRIGIIGTGAVGGYYGALLARNGMDVHFLLKSDYEHVSKYGMMIESKDGDFELPAVRAYNDPAKMPECDLVIVALKTTANHNLPEILPAVARPGGIILVLQNGLGVEADAAAAAPGRCVLGGLCFLCSNKVGPGHIRHLDYGSIRMGAYRPDGKPGGITEQLRKVAHIFSIVGVSVHLTDDLQRARWEKLVWNIPFNGLSVILDSTTKPMIEDPFLAALLESIMKEVICAANACGHDIPDAFAANMMNATRLMADYSPSMKLDYDAGRPMEIDSIYMSPIRVAREAGFLMSRTMVLAGELKFLESRNCKATL